MSSHCLDNKGVSRKHRLGETNMEFRKMKVSAPVAVIKKMHIGDQNRVLTEDHSRSAAHVSKLIASDLQYSHIITRTIFAARTIIRIVSSFQPSEEQKVEVGFPFPGQSSGETSLGH